MNRNLDDTAVALDDGSRIRVTSGSGGTHDFYLIDTSRTPRHRGADDRDRSVVAE